MFWSSKHGWAIRGLSTLRCFVYYEPPRHRALPAFDHRIYVQVSFADGVCKFRGVRDFVDYESLQENRRGCGKPIQVYTSELVMPEVFVFLFSKVHLTTGIVSWWARVAKNRLEKRVHSMKKYQKSQNEKGALRLGKAVGCKVAERVRRTDECPARIEKALDDERTATKCVASVGESVDVSVYTPLHIPWLICPVWNPGKLFNGFATWDLDAGSKPKVDYWELDDQKGAWKSVHIRLLFVQLDMIAHLLRVKYFQGKTFWKCRGKTSTFDDECQHVADA